MKTKLLILVLILIAKVGSAQDWSPFAPGQNSYYKQQYDNLAKVESFLLDSIRNEGRKKILYFNARIDLGIECYENLKQEFKNYDWLTKPDKIDSLIQVNDSVLYITNLNMADEYGNVTFIFKPFAKLNESWATNGVTIKCTDLRVQNVLGNSDSVKIFTCSRNGYDGIEFILSKTHGFLKFLPLNELFSGLKSSNFPPYFELIGYSGNGMSAGYKQPDFSEYFHLNEGDMLYWRNYSEPIDITIPRSTSYSIDSITYSFISSDSVYYDYKETKYDEDGKIVNVIDLSKYYLRKDEGLILQNQTSWFGLMYDEYPEKEIFFLDSLYFRIENEDTITYVKYQLPGLILYTSDCNVRYVYDYNSYAGFSTREGNFFQGTYSWGESSTTLIGSVIDGIKYGNTAIPTSLTIFEMGNFRIYPNPVTNNSVLYFDSSIQSRLTLKIINANGTVVFNGEYFENPFKIGNLIKQSGLYFYTISGESEVLTSGRFVKN